MSKYSPNYKDIIIYEAMLVILDMLDDQIDLMDKIDDVEWMLQTNEYRYPYLRRLEKLEDRFIYRLNQLQNGYRQ